MFANLRITSLRELAYRRKFLENRDENLFMGSFKNFADAEAGVPPAKAVGYDNSEAAKTLYSHQVYFYDYPALFWLEHAFDDGLRTVFDLGGHVGIKFYAFRRVLQYPAELLWTVCDVPGVVKTGEELAVQRQATAQLKFTTDFHDASGYDVLYASGSLQYLPTEISEIIAALPIRPKRVILNTTAVHPDRTLFTLNSIGFAVCPYRIQYYEELLTELTRAGYKRRDTWRNEGKPIEVPFVHGGDKAYYAGCCFDLLDP